MRVVRRPGRAGRRGGQRPARGGVGVRRRHRVPASGSWTAARHVEVQIVGDSHGNVVAPVRARVLDPAPPPEDHRGGARRRRWTTGCAPSCRGRGGRGRAGHRLRRARAPSSSCWTADGALLLPGDEHPAAGRAPGHRAGHRPRPGRAAARRSPRGTPLPAEVTAAADHRPRDRGPAVRRGPRRRLPARDRDRAPVRRSPASAGVRVDAGVARRLGGEPRTTTRCWPRSSRTARPGTRPPAAGAPLWRRPASTGSPPTGTCSSGCCASPSFRAGEIDTGYLDRHDPAKLAAPPGPELVALHSAAAALASQARRRTGAAGAAGRSRPAGATCPARTRWPATPAGASRSRCGTGSGGPGCRSRWTGRHCPGSSCTGQPRTRWICPPAGSGGGSSVHRVGAVDYVDSPLGCCRAGRGGAVRRARRPGRAGLAAGPDARHGGAGGRRGRATGSPLARRWWCSRP